MSQLIALVAVLVILAQSIPAPLLTAAVLFGVALFLLSR